jgi:hypothetical protein
MHFVDAWLELGALDLLRLVATLSLFAVPVFLPGARATSLAAPRRRPVSIVALWGSAPPLVIAGCCALWLALGWRLVRTPGGLRPAAERAAGLESGVIGLALGASLVALLLAAIAREDLAPAPTRQTSYALGIMGMGLLHLMLRRHAARAAFGIAALGLGLQLLSAAAREAEVPLPSHGLATPLLAAALVVALVLRVGESRERFAGSPWVGDAHLLHD